MSRVVVTGGAGFIGGAIAKRLVDRGDNVVVVDDLSTGSEANVPMGAEFAHASVGDPATWAALDGRDVRAILHLGAQSSGEISFADPLADFDVNARGTFLLLRWAERHGIRRVVYASSMAVYGEYEGVIDEDRPIEPKSFYGASKASGEIAVDFFGRHGGATTIFRMFNVYGPGQNLTNLRQGMASIYLAYLLKRQPIIVKGALDRYRDFVYIDDVADAWIAALDDDASIGRTFNLGSGLRTTVEALLSGLIAAAGETPGTYPIERRDGTPGDLHGSVADITKLTRTLSWRPRVPLGTGLERMVSWARLVAQPRS